MPLTPSGKILNPSRGSCAFLCVVLALLCAVPAPAAGANIAVLMSAKIDDYQEALRGFKETAGHRVVADYDMAQELDRGRKALTEIETKVKPDMVFVVGNWALQVVASQKPSVPAVYAMVLNPPAILGADARNITGASMNVPVEQSLSLIRQLGPSFKRVGVIFNPARTGYLVKQAEGVAWRVWSAPSRSASCRSRASRGQSPLST